MNAIPMTLKSAIGVGIGLFILFIGLADGGLVVAGQGTPVMLGNWTTGPILVVFVGLFLTIWLMARKVKAALLIGIVVSTIVAMIVNAISGGTAFGQGQAVIPSSVAAMPDLSTLGSGWNFDIFAKVGIITAVVTIFSLMLSDFFDTMGTVIGIGSKAGWVDEKGQLPRINRVLTIDSLAAVFGGLSGSSSSTTYVESAAGVAEGGRTGLTSVVTGILFLLAMFFAPIAGIVPAAATAPALILVGFLMASGVKDIKFDDIEDGLPALLTIVMMPFAYAITNGIGIGFITWTFLKVVRGKGGQVHWLMYLATAAFIVYFAVPWLKLAFHI
jgi:AGZA family xanthine/uracil permease-like MFS transporter